MQISGSNCVKCKVQHRALASIFLTSAQPTPLVMSLLSNPHWKMGESLSSKLHKIRLDFLLLHMIEQDCIYLQIIYCTLTNKGSVRSCAGWPRAQLCLHWISNMIVQNYLGLHNAAQDNWDVARAHLCKYMGWILYNCTRLNRIILYNCRALHITTNYCTLTKRNVRL